MAFALTKFKADCIRHTGPTRSHGEQIAIFVTTAADTDTDMDISDEDGTFWTDALADATYGDLATAAWNIFFDKSPYGSIPSVIASLIAVESETLLARMRDDSSPAGTDYSLVIADNLPDLGFASGDAPESMILVLRWLLQDGAEPVIADLGAAIT